jgi:spermidine synthase
MSEGMRAQSSDQRILALFTATIFLAAALLFLIQPMIAKMVLPRLGGSPEVWNTAMVFFQLALLGGYFYAHASVRLLGPGRQAAVHSAVLLLPLLALPIALPAWESPATGMESLWLVGLLLAAVGAPFVALATASPLLQRWFAGSGHPDARDPYFLYAGSNAGSLLGLLAYPFLLEPFFPLATQSLIWTAGYVVFVALSAACALTAARHARARGAAADAAPDVDAGPAPSLRQRLFWIASASVPSCLLIGATHYLTTDIAPIPLLWVVPLSVYLATFILAFAKRPPVGIPALSRWMAVLAVALALALLAGIRDPVWVLLLLHLSVLAVAGLLCHARLADARPAPGRLTEFYVFVAIGGVVGGAFAALAGPRLFNDLIEYPIAIVLACLFRVASADDGDTRARLLDVALPAAIGLAMVGAWMVSDRLPDMAEGPFLLITAVLPTLLCFFLSRRRVRFALGIGVLLTFAYSIRADRGDFLYADRTFFGVHRVTRDPEGRYNVLRHGSTIHGVQGTDPAEALRPLGYYHVEGPGGQVVARLAARSPESRLALVGLGAGALAVLTSPGQRVTIYEIDEAVVDIAESPDLFTYLANSPAPYDVVIADGRIALAETDERYDLIVLDAFSSDAIPLHLLTREAVALYRDRLTPRGVLLFHVSNQHLELAPVVGAVAGDLGLVALERVDPGRIEEDVVLFGSHWVLVARDPADFAGLADSSWRFLRPSPGDIVWTDDFSNVLSAFRWP